VVIPVIFTFVDDFLHVLRRIAGAKQGRDLPACSE